MSHSEVLHAAADMWQAREQWQHNLRGGAGGQVFADLYEAARRRCGAPAIVHVERALGAELRSGQLQHWQETDPARVVKVLREVAGMPVPADVEVVAMRREWDDLAARIAAAVPGHPPLTADRMVDALTARIRRLEQENAELRKRLEPLS